MSALGEYLFYGATQLEEDTAANVNKIRKFLKFSRKGGLGNVSQLIQWCDKSFENRGGRDREILCGENY